MYKYQIWGADVESDVPLDLENGTLKRKLLELKIQIDKENFVTTNFLVKDGKIRAFVDDSQSERWEEQFINSGRPVPLYFQLELNSVASDPVPIYY